ncbi:C80 family cysteine peptidase [Providencia sp. Je.9.19]|uniref:C80 family cysteine peptidase n=1 Tax=Providencia sp. Je.9.19 TaxID=3142844 RepID=UPI003DA84BEC
MHKVNLKQNKINFQQRDIITYIQRNMFNKDIKEILAKEGERRGISNEGYCYGFVKSFLRYSASGQGGEYLNKLNTYIDIINSKNNSSNKITEIEIDAQKYHARESLHKLIKDIVSDQQSIDKLVSISMFYSENKYPKITPGGKFNEYIIETINYNKKNSKYRFDRLYDDISKKQIDLVERYYSALFESKHFFNTPEGKMIELEPQFITLKEYFSDRLPALNYQFSDDDAAIFIEAIMLKIMNDISSRENDMDKNHGIIYNEGYSSDLNNKNYSISLEKFMSEMKLSKKNKKTVFYQFNSEAHAMAITVKYEPVSNSWAYSFFDPNTGLMKFHDQDDFFNYLKEKVKTNSKNYEFSVLDNGDYEVNITEFTIDKNVAKGGYLTDSSTEDITRTKNRLLSERAVSIFLDVNKKYKLSYESYDPQNQIMSLNLDFDGKFIKIHTNCIDGADLYVKLKNNLSLLSKLENDIFISEDSYQLFNIDNNVDLSKLSTETRIIDKSLGNPFDRLDIGFNDVYQSYIKEPHPKPAVGEQTPLTNYIDNWTNPFDSQKELSAFPKENTRLVNASEFDHNVVIQIGYDDTIGKITANAMSKHPNKTTVIQFDVASQQWKVLQGDLDAKISGKIRWIVTGHGQYTYTQKETLYEGSTSKQFSEGMIYLKNSVLTQYQPDKVVLIGCNLARGGVNQNFALKTSIELSKNDFNVPLVAYNRLVGNTISGKKVFWPIGREGHYLETKDHRLLFVVDKLTQKVFINDKPAVVYFIEQLHKGELFLWQLLNESESDFMQIFKNPNNNKIDIELIRKVAFNHDAYKLFIDEVKFSDKLGDGTFYQRFTKTLDSCDIKEAPLWLMVDSSKIENKVAHSSIDSDIDSNNLMVIIRSGYGDFGKLQVEKLASTNPNNTLIIQLNPNSQRMMVEYGDVEKLSKYSNQNWVLIDNITEDLNFKQNLASGLIKLKQRYKLNDPGKIELHLTDKKEKLTLLMKTEFHSELSKFLKLNGLDSDVRLNKGIDNELIVSDKPLLPPKRIRLDVASIESREAIETKNNISLFLEEVAIGKLVLSDLTLSEHPYLTQYFCKENGDLDINKINIAVYDPIVNRKVQDFLNMASPSNSIDKWNDLFLDDQDITLKQQAIETKYVLDFLSLQPEKIIYLSQISEKRLYSLFPAEYGFHRGDVLSLVNDPQSLNLYNEQIDRFLVSYNESKVIFKGDSLKQALQKIADINNYQQNNLIQLSIVTENIVSHTDISATTIFSVDHKSIHHIYSLLHQSDNLDGNELSFQKFIMTINDLKNKYVYNRLSPEEHELLVSYNDFYQRKLSVLDTMGITYKDQYIADVLQNLKNNQITYLKNESAIYTIISYSNDGKYYLSLLDSTGMEFKVSSHHFNDARSQFSSIFQKHIMQTIKQPDGSKISIAQKVGFQHDSVSDCRATVQQIDTDSPIYREFKQIRQNELQYINHINERLLLSSSMKISFGNTIITVEQLSKLGATIDGVPLNGEHIKQVDWKNNIQFDANQLASRLTILGDNQDDINLILVLKNIISDNEIQTLIAKGATFQERAVLKKQLKLIQHSNIIEDNAVPEIVKSLNKAGTKLPVYSRIANRFGQGMGAAGILMTINSIYQLIDMLHDPNLSEYERLEAQKNLYMACSNAFFNYGDMVLQPILLKIAYGKAGSFHAANQLAARLTIIFNLIGMGLDVYQAYETFKQLDKITDPKIRQDLIVAGSLSIANIAVAGLTIVGIILSSSVIPVIGLVIGATLLVGGLIYNGVRNVERIEEELGEELVWHDRLEEGLRGAFGISPSNNILNLFSYKQHITYFKNRNWQQDLDAFKASQLFSGFQEHLQFVENPILEVEHKYYIYSKDSGRVITDTKFTKKIKSNIFSHIDMDDKGPVYTQKQIDFISTNLNYDEKANRWRTVTGNYNFLFHFNFKFKLIKKVAPLSFKQVGSESMNEVLILNPSYENQTLSVFSREFLLDDMYRSQKNKNLVSQLTDLPTSEVRFFRLRNSHSNRYHPDITGEVDINDMGDEYINESEEISKRILSEKPEIIYEGMINIGYKYEEKPRSKDISFNAGGGNDIIIGKNNSSNHFSYVSGNKFFVGGAKNDIFNISLIDNQLKFGVEKLYFDGNGGNDTLNITNISINSLIEIDLNKEKSKLVLNYGASKELYLSDIHNVMLSNSRSTKFFITGNDSDNVIDAGSSNAFINGGRGNDQLIFESGIINGGDGNDNYYMRRFDWSTYINETKGPTDFIYLTANISENDIGFSEVNLGYSLDEIKDIQFSGNNLVVTIYSQYTVKNSEVVKYNLQANLTLGNVYREVNGTLKVNHQYRLRTLDGFILNSQLKDIEKGKFIDNKQIYEVTYHQDSDSLHKKTGKSTRINMPENIISIGDERLYSAPHWGKFNFIGLINKLDYEGSNTNDQLLMVDRNSQIMVSKGSDLYQISPEQFVQGNLTFDFSNVQGNYTENDRVIIALPFENGFELQSDRQSLYLKNRFGDKKLTLNFINYDESMSKSVVIQDSNSNLFQLELNKGGHSIVSALNVSSATDNDDYLRIPTGFKIPNSIIAGLNGHDVIEVNNSDGVIVDGGEGNDIIKVTQGYNVLYGGGGNNFVYGGIQSDLMLSDIGNDVLVGGEGDDNYLIDGSRGDGMTTIVDEIGNNHVHLCHFSTQYQEIIEDGVSFRVYSAISSPRKVRIKYSKQTDSIQMSINHYQSLPSHIPISAQSNMDQLVKHLSIQKQKREQLDPLIIWRPMDEFKNTLVGSDFTPIDQSSEKVYVNEHSPFRQLVLKNTGKTQRLWDKSGHGRVLMAQAQEGSISVKDGNNVLYSDRGENNLYGGKGNDILISNGTDGMLNDEGGKNIFIINGDKKGGAYIRNFGGQNTIHLINFKPSCYREAPNNIENSTTYTYESENGNRVKIYQYPNMQAPTVVHHKILTDINDNSVEQQLDYLVNSLASIRMQDEYSSVEVGETKISWDPINYVENFMQKVS